MTTSIDRAEPVTSDEAPTDADERRRPARSGLLESIGSTPLLELGDGLDPPLPEGVHLYGKLETLNPGGSIKDRPVSRIIAGALERGDLGDGRRLLDSSSGNAGIAYAMLGALYRVPVTLVIPGNASRERLDRIAAHGAEIVLTDPLEGYDFALAEAHRLADERPDLYWYADQYSNDDNWRAHYETTGPELVEQVQSRTGDGPDAFVAGIGTGGTITGVGRHLKEVDPDIHVAVILPERFPGIEGLKPMGEPEDVVPAILDRDVIDEEIPVSVDDALDTAAALARRGLFVGPSSGGYVHAATRLARRGEFRRVATVLNDTGERYGSTGMWSQDRT